MALIDLRVRDALRNFLPIWLSNRIRAGLTVGYRFVWALVAPIDALLDMAYQGLIARLPGLGTPTALPFIGRSRGILRGQNESQASYVARLRKWLDTWADAGSDELIVTVIHEYLSSHPKVTIITRGEVVDGELQPSLWTTIDEDGTVTQTTALWDWDTVSHPQRSDEDDPDCSDEWIIVHSTQWAERPGTIGDMEDGDDGFALGHMATHAEVDTIIGLLLQWKGAHCCFRAVIWETSGLLFDPTNQATCPNGKWGAWGIYNEYGEYVPSDRDTTTCRYWEPR